MAEKKTNKKQSPKNSLAPSNNSSVSTTTNISIRPKTTERTLIYKYCSPLSGKINLQKYMEKLIKYTIKDKLIPTLNDKDSFYFINRLYRLSGFCCGEMCLFTPDKHQEILEMNEDDYTCDISSISPNDITIQKDKVKNSNIKNQFVRSIMYFVIKENHIILAQSFALKAYNLEYYINKILQKQKLIASNQFLYLKDQINPDTIKKVNNAEYIRLFSPLQTDISTNEVDESKTYTHTLKGPIWEAFKSFSQAIGIELPSNVIFNKKLESKRIKGELTLRFTRKTDDDDTPVIGELANTFRNIDNEEIEYEIGLGNKNKLTKKDIKLSKIVILKHQNGLIDINELFLKMVEYFNVLNDIKRIIPYDDKKRN